MELEELKNMMVKISKVNAAFGTTMEKAAAAVEELRKHIPPYSEYDILLIELNPTLSKFSKWRLKRMIRKRIAEQIAREKADAKQMVIPFKSPLTEQFVIIARNEVRRRNRKSQRLKRRR